MLPGAHTVIAEIPIAVTRVRAIARYRKYQQVAFRAVIDDQPHTCRRVACRDLCCRLDLEAWQSQNVIRDSPYRVMCETSSQQQTIGSVRNCGFLAKIKRTPAIVAGQKVVAEQDMHRG